MNKELVAQIVEREKQQKVVCRDSAMLAASLNVPQNGVATRSSGHLDQILGDLGTELLRLSEQPAAEQDFERLEGELHQLFAAAERATLAHELEAAGRGPTRGEYRGAAATGACCAPPKTYTSAVGPITVQRTLYRAGCEQAVVPLELRAGIIEGHWTPRAAHQASFLVAHLTPQECANTLHELGNMSPSKSSLDRLPKQLSNRWEEQREAFEEALRAQESVPAEATTLAVSLDGVMAPMKDGARQAKRAATRAAGRQTKGPAGYREVGCGTVSFHDSAGERLHTLRVGRMPEAKKATLKDILSAEVERSAGAPARPAVGQTGRTRRTTTGAIWMSWPRRLTAARTWLTSFMPPSSSRQRRMRPTVRTICGDEPSTRSIATCYGMSPMASSG